MNTRYVNTNVFIIGLFALISFISVCLALPEPASSTTVIDVEETVEIALPAPASSTTVIDVEETVEITEPSDQGQAAKKAKLEAKAEAKARREAERKACQRS